MRQRKWFRQTTFALFSALLTISVSGCVTRRPVTMNLEDVSLNQDASAVVQAMKEYQVKKTPEYVYPAIPDWFNINRTVGIAGAEPGKITVFTRDEKGEFQWRDVQYAFSFYSKESMAESREEKRPLMVDPLQLSADSEAVAYQLIENGNRFIAVSERGRETVYLDGEGNVLSRDQLAQRDAEGAGTQFQYGWSSDGKTLLYYRMEELAVILDEEEKEELEEGVAGGLPEKDANVLILPQGVYGYDRETGQVRQIWKPMRLYLPEKVSRELRFGLVSITADANDSQAAMFILLRGEESQDIQIWNQNGQVETRLLKLPENPCIQIALNEGIYYYQESGEIRKMSLGKMGQSESVVYTDKGLMDFLVSEDGKRIFTIEKRGDKEDICLYIRDEKRNWYKQAIYVGAEGALSLQLSDSQEQLLVECRGEADNQALILDFDEMQK